MSPDSDSEFAAAIAAAAFAIHVHGAGGEVSSDPDYLRNKLMPMGRAKTRKQFDPVRPAESSRRFPDIEAHDASGQIVNFNFTFNSENQQRLHACMHIYIYVCIVVLDSFNNLYIYIYIVVARQVNIG